MIWCAIQSSKSRSDRPSFAKRKRQTIFSPAIPADKYQPSSCLRHAGFGPDADKILCFISDRTEPIMKGMPIAFVVAGDDPADVLGDKNARSECSRYFRRS